MSAPTGQRMLPASLLFPWRAWMHHPWLRSPLTWTVVALVAVPPLALTLLDGDGDTAVVPSAVVFAAYFAVAWAMVLRIVVRPQRVDSAVLGIVVALALVLELPVTYAFARVLDIYPDNLPLWILTVGVPEELAKLLPLVGLVLLYRPARTIAPRDLLFLGAVSGLVFGAVEAVHYVVDVMSVSSAEDGLTVVWRLVAGPATHACWAGISGYFLGLAMRFREPGPLLALAGIGIGVPAVLHGLNNWVAGTPAWVAVVVISALVFLGYAWIGVATAPPPRPAPAPAHPTPLDPPTVRIPAVAGGGFHTTRGSARPTVGAWTPTPRSAPSPSWRP